MVSDKAVYSEDFDTLRRMIDLMFIGYQANDRKINTESLDLFLTSFMSVDTVSMYKRKIKVEGNILGAKSEKII